MGKKKYLLLLTDFYPFDNREPYVKNEIKFLAAHFQSIFIFCSYQKQQQSIYELPLNTSSHFLNTSLSPLEKAKCLKWLFSKIFWNEIKFAKRSYQLSTSFSILKIILLQLQIAEKCEAQLIEFLESKNLPKEETILYSYWADARALAAAWLHEKRKITAISRAHGWDVYFERHGNKFLPFRKYLHDHLNALYFVSENGRNYSLQKIKGSTEEKFKQSYLGTFFHKRNPDAYANELVIVSCASLIPLKRIHLIAEILSLVKNIRVKWIHFGDGILKEDFLKRTNELMNKNSNIRFEFKGDVENETLLNFYGKNHVDLFLLMSEYEGLPLVIMEAMSFGIPVMATDAGGIREVVSIENGLLLDINFSIETAAKFITHFYSMTTEQKQNLRDAAFAAWQQKLNAEINYPAFINEITQL